MITKKELQAWLSTLPEDAVVATDESGMYLIETDKEGRENESDRYVYVGGEIK